MPNKIPLPAELQSLVEKREQPDRRKSDRRKTAGKAAVEPEKRRADRRWRGRRSKST